MRVIFILTIGFLFACNTQKSLETSNSKMPSPPVYIYKTVNDYLVNVPVILSEDKKQIVSYPAPGDLMIGSKLSVPTKLANGYLLDNRGINKNVAFLNYSYSEYYNLKKSPSIEELKSKIKDSNPLSEMYYCGKKSDFKNIEKELNKIIREEGLKKFKKIK